MTRLGRLLVLAFLFAVSPLAAQEPKEKEKVTGQKYALLIGVRQYDKTELESLPFTESDVRDLATVLKDAGYDHVILMTQTVGAEDTRYLPTAENIRREMKLLLQEAGEQDSILVALAGHGVEYRGSEEVYFCPADAKPSTKGNLVAFSEVYKELEECQAGFKLLLVDACRKDPQANATRRATVPLESVTRPQRKLPPGGVAALFSCSSGEFAHESKNLKHGVFFHYVIEGLRGQADLDGDKKITLPELELFTKKNVPAKVREEFANRQMPDLIGKTRGLSPLTTVETSESLAEQGKELMDKLEYNRAIRRFDAAIRKDPQNAWAYFHRAYAHGEKGEHDQAIADYTESIKLNSEDAAAFNNRGLAHYNKQEYERAIADYTQAIKLDPKDPLYPRNRGNAQREGGEYDQAIADYDAALQIKADDVDTFVDRGYAYQQKKNHGAALADYTKAIELKADYANAYAYRAGLHQTLDQFDEAIADYAQAIKFDPDNSAHFQNRGWIYYQQKRDLARALKDFDTWLRLAPDEAAAMRSKAVALVRLGKADEARRLVDKALELDADDAYSFATKGEVLYYAGKHQESVQALEQADAMWAKAATLSEDDQAAQRLNRLFLASIVGEAGDVAKAERMIRDLMKEDATNPDNPIELAFILLDHDRDFAEAERLLRQAMALDRTKRQKDGKATEKQDALHLANLGWALLKQGKVEQGLTTLEGVAADPRLQHVLFYRVLGDARLAAGKKAEALAAWKKALERVEPTVPDQKRKAEVEQRLKENR